MSRAGGVGHHRWNDRARRGTGGRRLRLRCGGPRFARTALRCSLRGATSTTRPWVQGLKHVEVVAEYRSNPAALRCSAPQRRRNRHPPAPLREPTAQLATARRIARSWVQRCSWRRSVVGARPWAGERRSASAAPRSAGAGGCASPQGDASSAACSSTEHRQLAQRDAGRARASSALAPGHRAQGSRLWHAGKSTRSRDRRSEAQPLARPRPCALHRHAKGRCFTAVTINAAAIPLPRRPRSAPIA